MIGGYDVFFGERAMVGCTYDLISNFYTIQNCEFQTPTGPLNLNGDLNYLQRNVKLYQEEARVLNTDSSFADKDAHKRTCPTKSGW